MRYILLSVLGLSPQIITETLFALHQNGQKVDEIHVITTKRGKEIIYSKLLSGKTGHFFSYLKEYGFDPDSIVFKEDTIHVIRDSSGKEIEDILNEEDNEALLRMCLELTYKFTKDPNTTVFFSIAGGRKTMSACLMFAAQMYGRSHDRIYHVLVSPEFERNEEFFYPPKESKRIQLRDENGNPYWKETKYAKVNLIHIPFVPLRNHLKEVEPETLLFSLIKEEKKKLVVDLNSRRLIYSKLELTMPPSWIALYAFFAKKKKHCKRKSCRNCTGCFLTVGEVLRDRSIAEIYKKVSKRRIENMSDSGIMNLSKENFNMYKGKIRNAILEKFGPYALKELEITSVGFRPKRYGILIDKKKIEIIG